MAVANDKYSMIKLMEKGLESHIKEVLEDRVITKALKEYEDNLRPKIREVVDNITLEGMEHALMDYKELKEEIRVHWSEKVINVIGTKE